MPAKNSERRRRRRERAEEEPSRTWSGRAEERSRRPERGRGQPLRPSLRVLSIICITITLRSLVSIPLVLTEISSLLSRIIVRSRILWIDQKPVSTYFRWCSAFHVPDSPKQGSLSDAKLSEECDGLIRCRRNEREHLEFGIFFHAILSFWMGKKFQFCRLTAWWSWGSTLSTQITLSEVIIDGMHNNLNTKFGVNRRRGCWEMRAVPALQLLLPGAHEHPQRNLRLACLPVVSAEQKTTNCLYNWLSSHQKSPETVSKLKLMKSAE